MDIKLQGNHYVVGGPVVTGAPAAHLALRHAWNEAALVFLGYCGVDLHSETTLDTSQIAGPEGVASYSEEYIQKIRSLIEGRLKGARAIRQINACGTGPACQGTCSAAVELQVPASEFKRLSAEKLRGPPLTLLAALDRQVYNHGDDVALTLETSRDAHVVVLALDTEKRWQRIFPNSCSSNGRIAGGYQLVLPDAKMRASPCDMTWQARLPTGAAEVSETLLVIASCNPLGDIPNETLAGKRCQGQTPRCCKARRIVYQIVGR